MAVLLDLNNPTFQEHWFSLEKEEQLAVLHCCGKFDQPCVNFVIL